MATYYCVKRPGECDGTCSVCPISPPTEPEFDFDGHYGAVGSSTCPETPPGLNGPAGPRSLKEIFENIIAEDPVYRKENARIEGRDDVNHPDHYTLGNIEVFDFIKAWDLSFAEGNVVKYTVRAPYKGSRLKDLKKARWYLDQLIAEAERADD